MNKKLLLLSFMLFCVALSYAQNNFTIEVTDPSGNHLSGVVITEATGKHLGITDSLGMLTIISDKDSLDVIIKPQEFSHYTSHLIKNSYTVVKFKEFYINTEDDVTVYAFAQKDNIVNVPAAVSVLNSEAFTRNDPSSFVAAANTVPGVKMDERSPGSYRISIRGNLLRSAFGVRNTKIYLNGLPFTDASGNTYFNELAVNIIDKITIIKGPGGSMYGAGTGGVILMDNEPLQKTASLGFTGGSYGYFAAEGKYNLIGTKTKQSISYTHQQSDGYREQTAMRRDVAAYTFTTALRNNKITGNILYSNLFYETPGGLTLAQLAANLRQARPAGGIFRSAKDQQAAIYLSTIYASVSDEIKLGSKWTNTTGGYFTYTDFKNPTIRNYEKKNEKGAGARTVFNLASGKWNAAAGAEYQYSFINTSTFGNKLGVKDTLQYHDKIDVHQVNIFAQAGVQLPFRITLTGGLSYNNFFYGYERVSIPGLKDQSDFDAQYIPRVTLLKKIANGSSAYFSYSKGYSPPTIDEIHASNGIFNKMLSAELGTNYEAGIKTTFNKNITADLSYYIFHLQNTIVSRRDASGADYYVNTGKTDQQGLEASIAWLPVNKTAGTIRKFSLQTNANYVHATFKDYQQGIVKYSGNKLTGTTPFTFAALADVTTAAGIYTNITYTYTDRIPLNDANTFFAKAYNLIYLKVGYAANLSSKLTGDFFAAWQHSFNENYSLGNDLNADANRFYNPSALQVFSAGVRLNLLRK